jgi:hypothetical protein
MNPFKFKLMDTVRIKELDVTGTIRQCLIVYSGIQYEVRYFNQGKAEAVWFYEDELEGKP